MADSDRQHDMANVTTATAVVDPAGTVSGWSHGARVLLGWSAEEAIGRPVTELLADPSRGLPGFPAADVGNGATGPVALRRRDGSTLEAEVTTDPLLDAEGRPAGRVLTVLPWERRPVIADRAFDQCPFALGVYDPELRFLWLNAAACRVIARSEEQVLGKRYRDAFPQVDHVDYTDRIAEVARTGKPLRYVNYMRALGETYAHAWATSMWPVRDAAGRVRAVANWGFDMSAEYWARQRLVLLNEASGGIGRTLDVTRTAQELARTPVPAFADSVAVDLFDEVLRGEEPPVHRYAAKGPVTLRRAARHATDQEPAPPGPPGPPAEPVTHLPGTAAARCLATGRPVVQLAAEPGQGGEWSFGPGLAADPAHWPPGNPVIDETIRAEGLTGRITAPLKARGAMLGLVTFARGVRPESFTADDLLLAEELAAKAAVALDNARRFSRERATALTLQRSLLPQGLPRQEAVDVASRYLPAGSGAGVGGDWFDLIPLSGARVALVVGDVVGHGLHASASMGRLRTAVRTLADVDLPPDELLTHLDDLIIHLTSDRQAAGNDQRASESGATCLYAVYDPVTRRCALASAGHPLPLLVSPEGTEIALAARPGPPLGIGGLPFEAAEFELPEGSLIALYTDGLVETRERDVDQGTAELSQLLRRSAASLEAACDTVLETLLPDRRTDDAALLLARTHALSPAHVATWDIAADAAQVPRARELAREQADAWGLEEAAFTTELVVSELVTNAIRYGEPPIRLRLIRDTSLICEVSDASDTAPHLRRARVFDEGGRGLLLVAQLTQGWGTRHATNGKTIWCAQTLPEPAVG